MKKIINIGLAAFMLFAIGACGGKEDGVKSVKIGEQTWMAKNLNDASKGGKCYENKPENCEKYGRLYTWEEAMEACPTGWRLPSDKEWEALVNFAGRDAAGGKLKAKSSWKDNEGKSGNGTDDYGFSALPGGRGHWDDSFDDVGGLGSWWSATDFMTYYVSDWQMDYGNCKSYEDTCDGGNYYLHSIRCIKTSEP
ncbi:MAG: hypothetical protein FWC15_07745 [Fibromonadales bacterium]|nr:hypothetical protein [Fibromonadales bacterium]